MLLMYDKVIGVGYFDRKVRYFYLHYEKDVAEKLSRIWRIGGFAGYLHETLCSQVMADMTDDTYKTIATVAEGTITEKRSKFIAYAIPVTSAGEVKEHLACYQKKYYDARHVCYAYMLGAERKDFRANDNGEPSGTAGKPILGQINSNGLTDVLVVVIRYFGGIKLGTSGLIVAYRAAAAEAIAQARIIEKTVDETITVLFEYPFMNDVMRIVKEEGPEITGQSYDTDCEMTLRIRRSGMEKLKARLEKVEGVRIPLTCSPSTPHSNPPPTP